MSLLLCPFSTSLCPFDINTPIFSSLPLYSTNIPLILATMASSAGTILVLQLLFLIVIPLFHGFSLAARPLSDDANGELSIMKYHNGHLLTGNIRVNLIWYGKFKPTQRAIISDFILSLSSSTSSSSKTHPSVSTWWKTTHKYYYQPITTTSSSTTTHKSPYHLSLTLNLGNQILDDNYSLSKSLTSAQILQLASKGDRRNAINVVLTSPDVTVDGFCSSRCGTHGSKIINDNSNKNKRHTRFAYIWIGNSETQCPGQCAWPFHQPIYGPQSAPFVAPSGDVGMDGMVINLASLLAGTATNPFGDGYYQGPTEAPLEAASACAGVYGKEAYPGYAGEVLVDESSGASFNAYGVNGRKYLLPALFDPSTSSCQTLV